VPANGNGVHATIAITEAHLDAFWSKLTVQEKADLFVSQLAV
jgi:hypothetical protein